ncbi:SDR family NAD(P)-dependent oxidoreductase [Polaromonas sp. P1-6]|nr:SDR family NAD(P)-dependent oxidoreductase [Polaromonas sp. P1-6]
MSRRHAGVEIFEMNVANKVTVVTGAASGIGRAMALYFAQQGAAAVVLADGRFLILPHPEVVDHMRRKAADRERWLADMRRLTRRFAQDGATGENHAAG